MRAGACVHVNAAGCRGAPKYDGMGGRVFLCVCMCVCVCVFTHLWFPIDALRAMCYPHARRNACDSSRLKDSKKLPQLMEMIDMLHVCRTTKQFDAVGSQCARIIEEQWEDAKLLKWFNDIVLDVHKDFAYNSTCVPGVLATNNCAEAWNNKTKHIWVTGLRCTTADVVGSAMKELVHGDSEELGAHVPFTRQPLKRMPAHIQAARDLLLPENTQYFVLQRETDRTLLFVHSSYEESVGRRQRGRNKKRTASAALAQTDTRDGATDTEGPDGDGAEGREVEGITTQSRQPVTVQRIKTYRRSLHGVLLPQRHTLEELRKRYLTLHTAMWLPHEQVMQCSCKVWWHQLSCRHVILLQHLLGQCNIPLLLAPVRSAPAHENRIPVSVELPAPPMRLFPVDPESPTATASRGSRIAGVAAAEREPRIASSSSSQPVATSASLAAINVSRSLTRGHFRQVTGDTQ
eukprot:GHVU01072171.1.p1 GENE.GHVU01072171.1~~GHVU01072171.1.p1  ORF type:complete len:461 (-),score=38.92 GHVU01072171.1:1431-2813(-)